MLKHACPHLLRLDGQVQRQRCRDLRLDVSGARLQRQHLRTLAIAEVCGLLLHSLLLRRGAPATPLLLCRASLFPLTRIICLQLSPVSRWTCAA